MNTVSILTGLERPVQLVFRKNRGNDRRVSILTGLERPVQRTAPSGAGEPRPVSILTGLERPVQRGGVPLRRRPSPGFNPHRP